MANSGLLNKIRKVHAKEGFRGVATRASKKLLPPNANMEKSVLQERPKYFFHEEKEWNVRPDKEKFYTLHNKFKGKRCFIVGNGPSLNKLDITKLNNEYSFGVNGIFYKTEQTGFKPTFYVVEDSHVMHDNVDAINNYETEYKFFPTEYKKYLKDTTKPIFFRMNSGFYEKSSPNFGVPRFSTDCAEKIYCGQSVTIINLQLAFYLGFSEVYLIGMDFSYEIPETAIVDGLNITSTEDDPNHFHPDYFGKGKKWHDPQLDRVLQSYRMCQLAYEAADRKIINATVGGKLELFDRADFNSLF